jgi:hypothetical protein
MPYNFPDLHADKHSIVRELFISTADDNYILARWCFQQELNVDFFWLAVHSLEKYFKAALLMNGHSSKGYSHRIVDLYEAVRPLAPELLPPEFKRPDNMPPGMWRVETVLEFLGRLFQDGNADNRYLIYGYGRNPGDLFKLDQVVFSVRRLAQALEVRYVGEHENDGLPTFTRREAIGRRPKRFVNLQSKLEETMEGKRGDELQKVLLNWNFPFTDHHYQHEGATFMSASKNPILITRLYDPLDYGTSQFAEANELWEWVKTNIQLPKPLVAELEAERIKRKAATTAAGRV